MVYLFVYSPQRLSQDVEKLRGEPMEKWKIVAYLVYCLVMLLPLGFICLGYKYHETDVEANWSTYLAVSILLLVTSPVTNLRLESIKVSQFRPLFQIILVPFVKIIIGLWQSKPLMSICGFQARYGPRAAPRVFVSSEPLTYARARHVVKNETVQLS